MTDITPDEPQIPEDPPAADDPSPEVPDQPLGPPADMPDEDAPLPGVPEKEPPASEWSGRGLAFRPRGRSPFGGHVFGATCVL